MAVIATWPSNLPQVPSDYSVRARIAGDSFDTEEGRPLRWATSTVFVREVSVTFECTPNEIARFWTFYRDDLNNGALPFYWGDPAEDGALALWDIVGDGPEAEWVGPTMWTLSLSLLQTKAFA